MKNIKLNFDLITFTFKNKTFYPTPIEFDLIELFVKQPNHIFSKKEIIKKVWAEGIVTENNMAQHIKNIRKKYGLPIKNRFKQGYYLEIS
jgi:DNA-binding winged helix-turn-helix (wHTH) protein